MYRATRRGARNKDVLLPLRRFATCRVYWREGSASSPKLLTTSCEAIHISCSPCSPQTCFYGILRDFAGPSEGSTDVRGTHLPRSMALLLGQCCMPGAAFNGECAADTFASGPCGRRPPSNDSLGEIPTSRSGQENTNKKWLECSASVPCECANTMISMGVTQAESDAPMPSALTRMYRPSDTYADYKCCSFAAGADYTDAHPHGCEAAVGWNMRSFWAPICLYGGSAIDNFVNCQLSCYLNGYMLDGWEAVCSVPRLPAPPPPPLSHVLPHLHVPPRNTSDAFPVSPRVCCPSGSTYNKSRSAGLECDGPLHSAMGETIGSMQTAAIACSCENRVTVAAVLHLGSGYADDLCDRWALALDDNIPVDADSTLDGWKLLCSADGSVDWSSDSGFNGPDSWSHCMYACYSQGYTPDQWEAACIWPSPLPPPPPPLPLPFSPIAPSEGCGSGCIGGTIFLFGLLVFGAFMVGRFYPGFFLCCLHKCFTKRKYLAKFSTAGQMSLCTEDVSLQVVPSPLNRHLTPSPSCGNSPSDVCPVVHSSNSSSAAVRHPTNTATLTAHARIDSMLAATHEIPACDIRLAARIGQGGMGQVFAASWLGTNVAVKVVKNLEASEALRTEANVLSQLRHPCLVSFFGTTRIEGSLAVVMEYMAGSLFSLLFKSPYPNNKPGASIRYRIAQETAAGIAHLHRTEFMHRDIKTSK